MRRRQEEEARSGKRMSFGLSFSALLPPSPAYEVSLHLDVEIDKAVMHLQQDLLLTAHKVKPSAMTPPIK